MYNLGNVDYKKAHAWYYAAFINGSVNAESELNILTRKMSNEELIDVKNGSRAQSKISFFTD